MEEKEGEEKEWKKKLKKWIEESREAEINTELKQILKEILQDFSKYEEFEELLRKYKNAKLTEKEREKLDFIINKFLNKYPIHLQLYYNLSGFKAYFQEQHWWNPWLIREIKYKFLNHLSKKYEILKQKLKTLDEFGQWLSMLKGPNYRTKETIVETNQILKKDRKINLEGYAKIISEFYREEVLESRKMLGFKSKQLQFDEDFIIKRKDFKDPKQFEEIVRNRKKYLWYGLLYEISEITPGDVKRETIAGYTTSPLSSRWSKYVFKAVLKEGKGGKLHRLIYDFLNQVGFEKLKTIDGKYNWRLIFGLLESRFKRTTVEIHFSANSLRSGEVEYIEKHDLINSGLNIRHGGGGGRDKIDLPMISIAYYIARGYMETEIHKIIIAHGIRCSVNTIRRRIREYWGSFEEAQIKFLKPMFYMLLKTQFELHEINDAYDRFTLNYIETMFEGKSYLELKKNVAKENLMNLPVINQLDGWEGRVKLRIPVGLLKQLLMVNATMNKAIKDLRIQEYLQEYGSSYYRYGFIRQIHNQLGYPTWEEARKNIVLPLIIKDLRGEQPFNEIYMFYGWSKSYAYDHNRISQTLFFGMRSEQIRQFLRNHPTIKTYDDLGKKIVYKKEKMDEELPLSVINKLIFKHINIDRAQQELNSRGYALFNFREEVKKYYSSWEKAFKKVKMPFLINAFKRGADPAETYLTIGYSKTSAINHNNISKRLFFGSNTEMVCLFLERNPQISTLEDFERIYNQGFLGD